MSEPLSLLCIPSLLPVVIAGLSVWTAGAVGPGKVSPHFPAAPEDSCPLLTAILSNTVLVQVFPEFVNTGLAGLCP